MKNVLFTLCFSCLIAGSIKAEETLIFSTIKGFHSAELGKSILIEAYQSLEINTQFEVLPAQDSITMANEGKFDGELARAASIQANYSNLLMIPIPILEIEIKIFTKNKSYSINKITQLNSYRLGIIKGNKTAEKITDGFKVYPVNTLTQIWDMLENNEIDIAVLEKNSALHSIIEQKIKNIKISNSALSSTKLYHFIHKKNKALFDKITASLTLMENNGRIKKLQNGFIYRKKKQANK